MKRKKETEAIKVVVRVRPPNAKEIQDKRVIITAAKEVQGIIEVRDPAGEPGRPPKQFAYDAVFSPSTSQRRVYDVSAAPIVQSVLEGYNGTIICYGQTGAGKTHTMEGSQESSETRGIIPNAFQHLFDHVALKTSAEKYLVRCSYYEIYNEEIRDLLSTNGGDKGLLLRESQDIGVYIEDLTSMVVNSVSEIDAVLQKGKNNRSVGVTLMNQGSSRSHAVFTVVVECSAVDDTGEEHIRVGKLNLVDLAGSERQTKTGATGERLKEATKINLSLSALGNVISALVDGKSQHVPYRDSKLTRILQDSLGGNTKTVMCANAGPVDYNHDETLSTLRYASRAKNIQNKPVLNEDPKDAMLREYQKEIARLREQLLGMKTSASDAAQVQKGGNTDNFNGCEINTAEEERELLRIRLDEEAVARSNMENERLVLQKQLLDMEERLVVGGKAADQAAKQEASLRKAEQELVAKNEKELVLARVMAEKEEAAMILESRYSSLSEEAAQKTNKLRKLWAKYQDNKARSEMEIKDLRNDFQSDRDDLLQNLRELNKELKLKEMIVANFIPPQYSKQLNDGAIWEDDKEEWLLPKLELDLGGFKNRKAQTLDISEPRMNRHANGAEYRPNVQRLLSTRSINDTILGNPYIRLRNDDRITRRKHKTRKEKSVSGAIEFSK